MGIPRDRILAPLASQESFGCDTGITKEENQRESLKQNTSIHIGNNRK